MTSSKKVKNLVIPKNFFDNLDIKVHVPTIAVKIEEANLLIRDLLHHQRLTLLQEAERRIAAGKFPEVRDDVSENKSILYPTAGVDPSTGEVFMQHAYNAAKDEDITIIRSLREEV